MWLAMIKKLNRKYSSWPLYAFFLVAATFLLTLPALYNRFPLFFPDSGSYLSASFVKLSVIDRPIGYSLLIKLSMMLGIANSLWSVVIIQAVITTYLIFKLCELVYPRQKFVVSFFSIFILVVFSSLAWYTSQFMPDLLSGLLILSIFLLFFSPPHARLSKFSYLVVIFLANIAHYSNMGLSVIACGLLGVTWLVSVFQRDKNSKKILINVALLVLSTLSAVLFVVHNNYRHKKVLGVTETANVFMVAKFVEMEILQDFLDENCQTQNYRLCQQQETLATNGNDFLWSNQSFSKYEPSWIEANSDFEGIVQGVFSQPKYIWRGITYILKGTAQQFFQLRVGSGLESLDESPRQSIHDFLPEQEEALLQSRQSREKLDFTVVNTFTIAGLLMAILCGGFFLSRPRVTDSARLIEKYIYFVAIGLFANAMLLGTVAIISDRYQSRISWLVALIVPLVVAHFLSRMQKRPLHF